MNYSTTCENKNLVIGQLSPNLWIVHKSAHIWILDTLRLKKELNVSDTHTAQVIFKCTTVLLLFKHFSQQIMCNWLQESKENVEELLNQWFSLKDDLSLLHPIHSLAQN